MRERQFQVYKLVLSFLPLASAALLKYSQGAATFCPWVMGHATLYNTIVQHMAHGSETIVQPMVDGVLTSHGPCIVRQFK